MKKTEERLTPLLYGFYCELLVDQLVRRAAAPLDAL